MNVIVYIITYPIVLLAILWNSIVRRTLWGVVRSAVIYPIKFLVFQKKSPYTFLTLIAAISISSFLLTQSYVRLPYHGFLAHFEESNRKGYDTFIYPYKKLVTSNNKLFAYDSFPNQVKGAQENILQYRSLGAADSFLQKKGDKSNKYKVSKNDSLKPYFEFWRNSPATPTRPAEGDSGAERASYYEGRNVQLKSESLSENESYVRITAFMLRSLNGKNAAPLSSVFPTEPKAKELGKHDMWKMISLYTLFIVLAYVLLTYIKGIIMERLMLKLAA